MLPLDHDCNDDCDPEDKDHWKLRDRLRGRAIAKASQNADQAWAGARERLPVIQAVCDKIAQGHPINEDETRIVLMSMNLVLGEIYLRKAMTAGIDSTESS